MGARKIREEIDAMEVLGVDPLERLVAPRVVATMFVAMMINGIVIAAGIGGGYFFTVIIQGGSAGAFLANFTVLASLPDLYISMIKAVVFGWLAAIVGAYKGLNAGGGPSGVGRAVNEAVIIAFMLLFFLNAVITAHLLPSRPTPGAVGGARMASIGRSAARSSRAAATSLEQYGDQLLLLRQGAGLGAARDPALPARDHQHARRDHLRSRRPDPDRRHASA